MQSENQKSGCKYQPGKVYLHHNLGLMIKDIIFQQMFAPGCADTCINVVNQPEGGAHTV
jgi:hypothetical protein